MNSAASPSAAAIDMFLFSCSLIGSCIDHTVSSPGSHCQLAWITCLIIVPINTSNAPRLNDCVIWFVWNNNARRVDMLIYVGWLAEVDATILQACVVSDKNTKRFWFPLLLEWRCRDANLSDMYNNGATCWRRNNVKYWRRFLVWFVGTGSHSLRHTYRCFIEAMQSRKEVSPRISFSVSLCASL